jgi:parallel beta-helix repeat protein
MGIVAAENCGLNNITRNDIEYCSRAGIVLLSSNNNVAKNKIYQYDTSVSNYMGIAVIQGTAPPEQSNIVTENLITSTYAESKAI